ncbi:MAG TPA: apolipoprotein N-acyltransferase [Phycisphaerae bacterium]|nr:apolipoprotein N-acyltransferase [Phycisphaerae bacterium]HPZ98085.1 apolipoprotein N-acyltransferase [Phycisphaerae bacterium]HQE27462.1 apolipoprotein N-acyltransferase [Phycisphaerae bacterium]
MSKRKLNAIKPVSPVKCDPVQNRRGRAARLASAALPGLASGLLLTLSFAPFGLAWLAWIGLVPWLLTVNNRATLAGAFAAGLMGGLVFFASSLWWLWTATLPGTVALILYFSLYWGLAGVLLRGVCPLRIGASPSSGRCVAAVLIVAAIWTGVEWLRAYLIRGFPWLLLGCSQTPYPVLCQIADATGASGITFCLILVNALGSLVILQRERLRSVVPAVLVTAAILLAVVSYGAFRLGQDCTTAGPSIMVVQPNNPHLPGGTATASREAIAAYHLDTTRRALAYERPDLVVWPETVMPPLNAEAREQLAGSPGGETIAEVHEGIARTASAASTTIVTGGYYVGDWKREGTARVGTDLRNSAYCYTPEGQQTATRYDKSALVPFAETVAFQSVPWLHRIMLWLSPPVAAQPLVAGDPNASPVFELPPLASQVAPASASAESQPASRPAPTIPFISPICLENIEAPHVARLLRSPVPGRKRAEFLVNLSNDGWFSAQQHWQHWQMITLRCIENRVPMARSCNTGISGFIDSNGRTLELIPPYTEGIAVHTIALDRRISLYNRYGEWFGVTCVVMTALTMLRAIIKRVHGARL